MAKIDAGINGPVRGKVGRVVGVLRDGEHHMRAAPRKRTAEAGDNEMAGRERFRIAHYWLKPVCNFVREGFAGYSKKVYGFNAAKSFLLKKSIEKKDTGFVVNPALVKLSHGDLLLPASIAARRLADDLIEFTWDNTPLTENEENETGASELDQVMLLVYDIEGRQSNWTLTGLFRKSGADTLELTSEAPHHCWLAFVAADRSKRSESVYLGVL